MEKKHKILLVEDQESIQVMMKEMLELLGCDVTAVTLGEQALEIIKDRFFDYYFIDIVMPDIDGFEVIKEIKKKESLSKIIVTSGSLDAKNLERAREIGVERFMAKPIKMYDIKRLFKEKSLESDFIPE